MPTMCTEKCVMLRSESELFNVFIILLICLKGDVYIFIQYGVSA